MLSALRGLAVPMILATASVLGFSALGTGVECPPDREWCSVTVEDPGTGGTSGPTPGDGPGGSSERECVIDANGWVVPCYDDVWGWFSNADDCYWLLNAPQPPSDDPAWLGHFPDGAVYTVTCLAPIPGSASGWAWLATPPPGFGAPSVTPVDLAQRAVDQMQLVGPEIRMTGAPNQPYVVGVPLWLWTDVSAQTWGPASATAAVPGLAVTATAQATRITWDMGDGNSVVCGSPGTAYYVGAPVDSPTCDYTYVRSSAGQPGDAWTITATATWQVAWTGGGTSGVLTVTRTSQTSLQVGEVQVLITG